MRHRPAKVQIANSISCRCTTAAARMHIYAASDTMQSSEAHLWTPCSRMKLRSGCTSPCSSASLAAFGAPYTIPSRMAQYYMVLRRLRVTERCQQRRKRRQCPIHPGAYTAACLAHSLLRTTRSLEKQWQSRAHHLQCLLALGTSPCLAHHLAQSVHDQGWPASCKGTAVAQLQAMTMTT
jgi:hypothetical protein